MNNNEAYIFAGHGTELSGSFTVPKGHIIIVLSHSGDAMPHEQHHYKAVLDNDNRKYILDPLNNIDKLTELLGVFAIYKGNDDPDPNKHERCPKLYHSMWHTHGGFLTVCDNIDEESIWPSGLIKLTSSTKLYDDKDSFLKYVDNGLCINDLESGIFNKDKRRETIQNIEKALKLDPNLLSLWRSFVSLDENKEVTPYNLIKKFKERYKNNIEITQEDFCNSHVVEDGKYIISYALNCRNINGSGKLLVNEDQRADLVRRNLNMITPEIYEENIRSILEIEKSAQGNIITLIIEKYKTYDINSKYYTERYYTYQVCDLIYRIIELNKNNIDYLDSIKNKLTIFLKIIHEKSRGVKIHYNIELFVNSLFNFLEQIKISGDYKPFRKNTFLNPVSKQISEAFKQRRNSAQAYIQNRTKKNERKQNIYRVLNKKENTRDNTNRKKLNNFRKDFPEVENDYIIDRTRNATNANLNTINRNNLTKRLKRLEKLSRKRLNNNSVKYGIKKVTAALQRKINLTNITNRWNRNNARMEMERLSQTDA